MSESALSELCATRARSPYAERADAPEGALERGLQAAASRFARFLPHARAAEKFVAAVDAEQPAADGLTDARLTAAAADLRAPLLRAEPGSAAVARAFALVRAAARRSLGQAHYPVQLMGGHYMLSGALAEMPTGEGKTLTATLPAAVMALAGKPVHIVTVNDYLAERDARWMAPVFAALGLRAAAALHAQEGPQRRAAYAADITYCTNKQLGFDYLRDRLALPGRPTRAQLLLDEVLGARGAGPAPLLRGLHFAIVDEADSVLIDEARTPLIISGAGGAAADAELYAAALAIARTLEAGTDFTLDARARRVALRDAGRARVAALAERLPGVWASRRGREELVGEALAALHLYQRDTHYVVQDGKVKIVDEFTGRVFADRSWERGLHQCVEVKEACGTSARNATLARVTYQRLFRRYLRLAGMSGTAWEVGPELAAVYGLAVRRVPPHRPVQRKHLGVFMYRSAARRWQAVVDAVAQCSARGQPVLVGTRSVAASEHLGRLLAERNIAHALLNARQDASEADIVEQAGQAGRVTVATNMAGRGTDIALGAGVAECGGLHVILTELHESARIDRQLFGRAARQGDPGSCAAMVSLEDEIFQRHARAAAAAAGAGQDQPEAIPARIAAALQGLAQYRAERAAAIERLATLESDRQLDRTLAFAGTGE
ncbi:MAG: preprotein translocase subunit SecA [Rhodocyclaceae bacterium]|nr:preprotein translocase subunit SecA [Rhodocyclaceae bacterium]MBX3671131.1 preprotein translocase subunit SecA [Rhodocyclaceae bacterium]